MRSAPRSRPPFVPFLVSPPIRRNVGLVLLAGTTVGAALAPGSRAQTFSTAVIENQIVPGVGRVSRIDNVAINDDGDWLVEADTDHADTNRDQVLLENGTLLLREDDALSQPSGARLDSFDSINLGNSGHSGWNFFLDGTSGTTDDSGIYYDSQLVIQEGDVSGAPEFSAGTPWRGFFDAKLVDLPNPEIVILGTVDDVAIPSSVEQAFVRARLDPAGNLLTESVIVKERDTLPGQAAGITTFGTGPHQSAVNDLGELLFFADLGGPTTTDGVIYRDGTLIAQEGSASPVAGRNWELLSSRSLDLNVAGDWVHKGNLDGSTADDEVIVSTAGIVAREGNTLPAIAPFLFTTFGSGPVRIDDLGNVLWYGDWDDPDTDRDTGLFRNDELLVQEGVTVVSGFVVDAIAGVQDAFEMSPDGRWVIFEGTLSNGLDGAFLIELDTASDAPAVARGNVTLRVAPNPFRTSVGIEYSLERSAAVSLDVFDVQGRRLAKLGSGLRGAGSHRLAWGGRTSGGGHVAPGVYFLRLRIDGVDSGTEPVVRLD